MDYKIDRQISAASAILQALYRVFVVKRELNQRQISVYCLIFVLTLTYGHEL